jgi:hypothetical protein
VDLTLDPIEKAIRAAFEKGDASDRAYRERVYRSAFSALDRAMQSNANITEAMMQRRRQEVSAKISEIESEFLPAVPSVEAVRPTVAAAAPTPVVERREPTVSAAPVIEPRDRSSAPVTQPQPEAAVPAPSRRDRAQKTRRSWVSPLIALLIFAAIIGGGWWFVSSGGLSGVTSTASQSTPSTQPVQPLPMREPDAGPSIGGAADLADWITVFDPSDPTSVSAPGDSTASVDEEDGQSFIRIASGASGSPIRPEGRVRDLGACCRCRHADVGRMQPVDARRLRPSPLPCR